MRKLKHRKISSFQTGGKDPQVPTVPSAKENYRVKWGLIKPKGCPEGAILKQIWVEQTKVKVVGEGCPRQRTWQE